MKPILKLLFAASFALLLGAVASVALDVNILFTALPLFLLSFIPSVRGVATMAVQVEIWENDIIEGLWADNAFLNFAVNVDQYVLNGKVVHIPQAGAAPNVVKNRNVFPAQAKRRSDTDVTYTLDEYTTDPVHITDAEDIEDSYDKRASVMSETRAALNDVAAQNMIYNWLPTKASSILRTTGDPVAAHLPAATGNRKAFRLADLKTAMSKMNAENVPANDRYALIDALMYDQMTNEMTANQQREFLAAYEAKTGIVGKIFGFNIIMRSSVGRYSNAGTPVRVLPDAADAATLNAVALCWQKSMVERALGDVKFYEDKQNPLYYGDIYSAAIRLGGRIRREDEKGVIAIVQDVAA